jgi:predicted permease
MNPLSRLFARRRRYADLSVSIHEHIAERSDELVAEGLSRPQAEQAARREFGNVPLITERSREIWQWPSLESIFTDIRFALRQLLKSPAFTITAVLTLALGIAINATMFSMVSAFLLPHLPGRDPQSIVVASSVNPYSQFVPDTNPVSVPNYLAWKSDTTVFAEMAALEGFRTANLSEPGHQPEAISYSSVSPNYLSLFGVVPAIGRDFLPSDDQPGHDHVLLLSHGLWERRFGSDPSIVGRTVRLNREDYLVLGVMPDNFRLLGFAPQAWTPLTLTAADRAPDARKNRSLYLFARLSPGVTLDQARAQLRILANQDQKDFPAIENHWGASARALPDFLIYSFGIRSGLSVMMAVVVFILLIACANVAGLLLTRAVGRQKELAIRMSLGASRTRVVRQLLTEGVVIALLGGAGGLLLALGGIRILRAGLNFNDAISAVPVTLDTKVLVFAAAISLASAILSSMAPALKAARTEINTDLKSETRGATSSRSRNRMRVVLVGGEIALALFLLIGTGLLIRGVYLLDHQKLGFSHDHLLTAGLVLDKARYPDSAKQDQFVRDMIAQLRQIPGIAEVAVASNLPATGPGNVSIHIKGQPELHSNETRTALEVVATPDFFQAAGVPLLRGRTFTPDDDANRPNVLVVSQEFVRKYFQNHDPIGQQIQLETRDQAPAWRQIVGVVADVKTYSEDPRIEPTLYEPWAQHPVPAFSVMLRSNMEPDSLIPSLRRVLGSLDAELPLLRVMSMDQVIESQRAGNPLFSKLLAAFAFLALVLSAIGIYGLIAYSVGQRTQEIGIRMALGAKRDDISRMILREGLKVVVIGSAIGLLLAIPLPNLFDSIFQGGLKFGAPAVYPLVLILLLAVALLAMFGPARRATRVNPTEALRSE